MNPLPAMLKLVFLLLLGAVVWNMQADGLRDSSAWLAAAIAPLLAIWLGWPWRFQTAQRSFSWRLGVAAAITFTLGSLLDVPALLSCGWTALAAAFFQQHLTKADWNQRRGLLVLLFLSFPWIAVQDMQLGWWFRLTGAWTAEQCFRTLGFDVLREGVQVIVAGQSIDVEPACAGLHSLHAMLVAGSALGWLHLGSTRALALWTMALPCIAWLTNTLRICLISAYGLHTSPEAARGTIHEMGGWLVIMLMFMLCSSILTRLSQGSHIQSKRIHA